MAEVFNPLEAIKGFEITIHWCPEDNDAEGNTGYVSGFLMVGTSF